MAWMLLEHRVASCFSWFNQQSNLISKRMQKLKFSLNSLYNQIANQINKFDRIKVGALFVLGIEHKASVKTMAWMLLEHRVASCFSWFNLQSNLISERKQKLGFLPKLSI
jgi:uncharacterized protein involved in tolerance to divalent cations